MRSSWRVACGVTCALLLAGPARAQTISGTATYSGHVPLPPAAVFEALLLDVSRMDVAAQQIGRVRIESPGESPIGFSISYNPAAIVETRTYVVRATIRAEGKLWFTTDQAYPVLTGGHGTTVALTLSAVNAPAVTAPARAVSIESTYWRLARLGGDDVSFPASPSEPHLIFEAGGRVTGGDGCNTLRGLYALSGTNITIGPIVGTRMICEEIKGLDARFREAVGAATAVRASRTTLDLLDSAGTVLASFTARAD